MLYIEKLNLFEYLVVLSASALLDLSASSLLGLADASAALSEQGERVDASLLLQAHELLREEVQHVRQRARLLTHVFGFLLCCTGTVSNRKYSLQLFP